MHVWLPVRAVTAAGVAAIVDTRQQRANGDAVSTYGERLWAWLAESLQKFKDDARSDPGRDWRSLTSDMWSRLGVAAGADDPVIRELITLVDDVLGRVRQDMTGEARAAYLAGTELDRVVVEQIELAVTRHGPTDPAPIETVQPTVAPAEQPSQQSAGQPAQQPVQQPAEVSEEIVRELALPVLRELAKTRPDVLARHSTDELLVRFGQMIARRLAER